MWRATAFPQQLASYYIVPKKEKAPPPNPALLIVNKMIRAEAIRVFYGQNTWRIGPNVCDDASEQSVDMWCSYSYLFRHAVLYFNQFDIDPQRAYSMARSTNLSMNGTRSLHHATHHFKNADIMFETWLSKLNHLEDLKALRTLVFDVERLTCLGGCCRYDTLRYALRTYEEDTRALSLTGCHITVRGLHTASEVQLVREEWPYVTADNLVTEVAKG